MSDMNELFNQFENADYPTRLTLFRQALSNNEMDGEWAFEMLNELFFDAAARGERAAFNELVAELQAQVPEAYESEAAYLLDWQISNDLADGRFGTLPNYLQPLAELAGEHPDIVNDVADRLAYYGQLALQVRLYRQAWEPLQSNEDIVESAVEEFAILATNAIILHYLETAAAPRPDDPDLLDQLDLFVEVDAAPLAEHMAQVTGQEERTWSPEDFVLPRDQSTEIPDRLANNLTHLLRRFVHYLQTAAGMPAGRAALAYWPLADVIYAQIEHDLQHYRPKRKKKKSKYPRKKTAVTSYLCPNKRTLADYLSRQLDTIVPRHYRGAALIAALPAWFQYLRELQLIDAVQEKRARQQVTTLLPELREFWRDHPEPALQAALDVWK